MNIWIVLSRILIVGSSIVALILWVAIYRRMREPFALAAISWLVDLVLFNIFRFVVKDGTEAHIMLVNSWSIALHLHAVVLLIIGAVLFWDKRLWIWKR